MQKIYFKSKSGVDKWIVINEAGIIIEYHEMSRLWLGKAVCVEHLTVGKCLWTTMYSDVFSPRRSHVIKKIVEL